MANNRTVIWAPEAEQDFSNILEFLEFKWNKAVANQFFDVTFKTMNWIASNPRQFQIIFKKRRIRKCVLTKQNTIYFKEHHKEIIILRIFDSRQNPKKLKWK